MLYVFHLFFRAAPAAVERPWKLSTGLLLHVLFFSWIKKKKKFRVRSLRECQVVAWMLEYGDVWHICTYVPVRMYLLGHEQDYNKIKGLLQTQATLYRFLY